MNGKYIVSLKTMSAENKFEQFSLDKDPTSEPWDDVRGVLDSKFIRIGDVVLNAQEILAIRYEETLNVA